MRTNYAKDKNRLEQLQMSVQNKNSVSQYNMNQYNLNQIAKQVPQIQKMFSLGDENYNDTRNEQNNRYFNEMLS